MGRLREKLETALRSRKCRLILCGLGIAAIMLAGVWLYFQKRAASVEYAVAQLNQAIASNNVEQLARMVDFYGLSAKLGAAMAEASPEDGAEVNSDARQRCQDAVQRKLLNIFSQEGGDVAPALPAQSVARPENPDLAVAMYNEIFDILRKPTSILPPNFLSQLKDRPLAIHARDDNTAILSTTVEHAQLKHVFSINLAMQRNDQGWRVSGLADSARLVNEFWDLVKESKNRALEAIAQENDRQRLLMNTYYNIRTCRSALFPPDAGGVTRLRVTVEGSNLGERDIFASGSKCDLLDRNDVRIASLRLENTRTVKAGERFEHGWFYSFLEDFPEVEALVAAGEVSCVATATTVLLGRGSVLYFRDPEEFPGVRLE